MTRIETATGTKAEFADDERALVIRVLSEALNCESGVAAERIRALAAQAASPSFEPQGDDLRDLMRVFAFIAASDLELARDEAVIALEQSLWSDVPREGGIRFFTDDVLPAHPQPANPSSGRLTTARFSLDDRLVLLHADEQAYLWDLVTAREEQRFHPARFALDMLGSETWTIPGRAWRAWTATEVYPNNIGAAISMSRDHRRACIDKDNMLVIVDTFQDEEIARLQIEEGRTAIMSPDGRFLTTAGGDEMARVWNLDTGELVFTLNGHTKKVNSAVFSEDGNWIVTASDDGTARIWDTANGAWVAALMSFPGGQWMVADPLGAYDAPWAGSFLTAGLVPPGKYVPGLLRKALADSLRDRETSTIH
ncbi:MAG: WD40 repeat domain-containing protein [Bryobacteraceae bacterium]|nr:WD40 repeat domain-containing protein [Bryobacteraceae bacterium]